MPGSTTRTKKEDLIYISDILSGRDGRKWCRANYIDTLVMSISATLNEVASVGRSTGCEPLDVVVWMAEKVKDLTHSHCICVSILICLDMIRNRFVRYFS